MKIRQLMLWLVAGVLVAAPPALADSVSIAPSQDNTLYQDDLGALSNGAGGFMFAGAAGPGLRRAVMAFDVAAAVPAGSTIHSARLVLHCSRTNTFSGNIDCTLHRVLAAWGEGASDAGDPGGNATTATAGDATWIHTYYDTGFWTSPGGDFSAAPSASASVGGVGSYNYGSTPEMVADAQSWLETPSGNFGWMLRGAEAILFSAKRFDTRETPVPGDRPELRLEFTPPPVAVQPAAWTAVKALFRD